jgi:hypothetical protein
MRVVDLPIVDMSHDSGDRNGFLAFPVGSWCRRLDGMVEPCLGETTLMTNGGEGSA